ncbi:MAG TPA: PEGA domain-containing protein [Vicinamibacterales bacterium]
MTPTTYGPEAPGASLSSEFRLAAATQPFPVRGGYGRYVAVLLGALVVGLAAIGPPGAGTSDGSLRIESEPRGADVRINGEWRGQAPLMLPLPPGEYTVVVGRGDQANEHRVTLWAGERASIYHVAAPTNVIAEAPVAPPKSAALSVVTEPAGGSVDVDGVNRGTAPVVIRDLDPGEHRLVVRSRGTVYQRTVVLETGTTSTVVVGAGAAANAGGWLRVQVPVGLQIHEGGRRLGTTESDALMLPAGQHELAFSDEASGFRAVRVVQIQPGETTSITLEMPRAAVNVNAIPWAEVWVDNERIGETPIGNHLLTIGTHEVELRHPELGTRRVTMAVSHNGTNRLAVNMREQ